MNVLWVCNTYTNAAADLFNLKPNPFGGWIESLLFEMKQNKDIKLFVLFKCHKKTFQFNKANDVFYCCFDFKTNIKKNIKFLQKMFSFDVIHFHGAEFKENLKISKYFDKEKIIVSIQGLKTKYSEQYLKGVDNQFLHKISFSFIGFRDGSIYHKYKRFVASSRFEIDFLKYVQNVFGRTNFDKNSVLQINTKLNYYHAGEVLRKSFYSTKWNYNDCRRHSIYISQAGYPIKGLHIALKGIKQLKDKYNDLIVYVGGPKQIIPNNFKDRMKISSYGLYISSLINELGLMDTIHFVGLLTEEEVLQKLKSCNVFLLPSLCENSSNALGEAMLIGAPIVCSSNGGNPEFITNEIDGFTYDALDYNDMALKISKIFDNKNLATCFSETVSIKAEEIFDKKRIVGEYLFAYKKIGESSHENN